MFQYMTSIFDACVLFITLGSACESKQLNTAFSLEMRPDGVIVTVGGDPAVVELIWRVSQPGGLQTA